MKGGWTTQFTVWCGNALCLHFALRDGSKRECVQKVREIGWRRVERLWLCPCCVVMIEKGEEAYRAWRRSGDGCS